jgi:hypothetical protein
MLWKLRERKAEPLAKLYYGPFRLSKSLNKIYKKIYRGGIHQQIKGISVVSPDLGGLRIVLLYCRYRY